MFIIVRTILFMIVIMFVSVLSLPLLILLMCPFQLLCIHLLLIRMLFEPNIPPFIKLNLKKPLLANAGVRRRKDEGSL